MGCNILMESIPESGKIFYVKNNKIQSKDEILKEWNKTSFLKDFSNLAAKGWLLDIVKRIEMLEMKSFSLQHMYQFENYLKIRHPENNNIEAKIRQQLQILRDKTILNLQVVVNII